MLASNDQLGALLDAAVDGMILIDPTGRVTRFNLAAERMFGYAEAEVLGRNVSMLMPKPYREEHDQYLRRYLCTAQPHIIGIGREVTAQRHDGSIFPIHLSVGEFGHGSEQGFVGILHDITERKRREDELRNSNAELLLMFQSAPIAIQIFAVDGVLLDANTAFEKLFGYTAEELRGRNYDAMIDDLVIEEYREILRSASAAIYQSGDSFHLDLRFRARDGRMFHGKVYVGAVRDTGHQIRLLISQIIDLSAVDAAEHEAEELRARLAHVSRLGTLGEMASGIAHEVNQPLTAIANYASALKRLLLTDRAEPAELAATLAKISVQAERAGQIIQGLRKLTRRRDTEHAELNCNALIREVSRLIELELRFSNHELLLRLDPSDPKISGDGVQFQQVILNLIRNSLEAMQDTVQGKAVIVTTLAQADNFVEVVVTDTGPGLPIEVAERLFEPFFTTKPQGMGLGLSICRSIVSALGGQLHYRQGSAGGAEFVLRLPQVHP